MYWKDEGHNKWRLWEDQVSFGGFQRKRENLAVVSLEPDGRYFWRVFEAIAWELPGEPYLTLQGIEMEGYFDALSYAQRHCETIINQIKEKSQTTKALTFDDIKKLFQW